MVTPGALSQRPFVAPLTERWAKLEWAPLTSIRSQLALPSRSKTMGLLAVPARSTSRLNVSLAPEPSWKTEPGLMASGLVEV
jgi:hypothetical protein